MEPRGAGDGPGGGGPRRSRVIEHRLRPHGGTRRAAAMGSHGWYTICQGPSRRNSAPERGPRGGSTDLGRDHSGALRPLISINAPLQAPHNMSRRSETAGAPNQDAYAKETSPPGGGSGRDESL